MNKNLNDELIERFGLSIEKDRVNKGFLVYAKNRIEDDIEALISPSGYDDKYKLYEVQRKVSDEICRQLHFDESEYHNWDYGMGWLADKILGMSFYQAIYGLQVLLNVAYKHSFLRPQIKDYINSLNSHLDDYPIIGLTIKTYKAKPPQIYPTTSKEFTSAVSSTISLLENKYADTLEQYESGMKGFLTAISTQELKNVVEDMYTACDTIVQTIHGGKNGLRSLFVGKSPIFLGINQWQLKMFDQMRDWMDKIKHGSLKEYDRTDVEMIILTVSMLIKLVIRFDSTRKVTTDR